MPSYRSVEKTSMNKENRTVPSGTKFLRYKGFRSWGGFCQSKIFQIFYHFYVQKEVDLQYWDFVILAMIWLTLDMQYAYNNCSVCFHLFVHLFSSFLLWLLFNCSTGSFSSALISVNITPKTARWSFFYKQGQTVLNERSKCRIYGKHRIILTNRQKDG